jgi:hypothetical protein
MEDIVLEDIVLVAVTGRAYTPTTDSSEKISKHPARH